MANTYLVRMPCYIDVEVVAHDEASAENAVQHAFRKAQAADPLANRDIPLKLHGFDNLRGRVRGVIGTDMACVIDTEKSGEFENYI